MPRAEDIDKGLRVRLALWTVWLKREYGIKSDRAFARRIEMASPTVSNLLNHGMGGGLDYLAALHRHFRKSADTFLDTNPPDPVELPAKHPERGKPPPPEYRHVPQPQPQPLASPPRRASPSPRPARRKKDRDPPP